MDTPNTHTPDAGSQSLADELLAVEPSLLALMERHRLVTDVLDEEVVKTNLQRGEQLRYLPKGKLEDDDEYERRIRMTPFFPETPSILSGRQGQLFRKPPKVEGLDTKHSTSPAARWVTSVSQDGKSLVDFIAACSEQAQRGGFCGILLDRRRGPVELEQQHAAGTLSKEAAQAARLSEPVLVLYPSEQILEYQEDNTGLKWVRLVEGMGGSDTWQPKSASGLLGQRRKQYRVRVFDRKEHRSWVVTEEQDGRKTVVDEGATSHDWGFCPMLLFRPFRNKRNQGVSILRRSAEADVAATRVLSDVVWTLYVLGNPILAFYSNRGKDEASFATGPTRYIQLKAGNVGQEGEDLRFIVLDTGGLALQMQMHERFIQEALKMSGESSPAGIEGGDVEQSGVSRAWQFATGEQRILFMLTVEIQRVFGRILDVVMPSFGLAVGDTSLKCNLDFTEGVGVSTATDEATKILDVARPARLAVIVKAALLKLADCLNLSEEDRAKAEAEIDTYCALLAKGVENGTEEPEEPLPGKGAENATRTSRR